MKTSELKTDYPKKFVGLELLRWVSAIGVLFWHYQHFFYTKAIHGENFKDFESLPLYSVLHPIYLNGAKGVQLFWAISGFVIIHNYGYKRIKIHIFVKNRFARLYPLHLITLLVVSILQLISMELLKEPQIYFENTIKNFFLHLFFVSGWGKNPSLSFNQPIWSVSLEILVYAGFVILMLLPRIHRNPTYYWAPLFALIYALSTIREPNGLSSCLLFFSLGAILRCLLNKINGKVAFASFSLLILSISDAYLFGNLIFESALFQEINPQTLLIIQVSSLIALAIWIDSLKLVEKMSSNFRILGNLTYGTYLLHVPFQIFMLLILNLLNISVLAVAQNPGSLFAYLLLLNFSAYWVYTRIETPLNKYFKGISPKRS